MIPGCETCPPHWKKEYTGYMMVENHSSKHSGQYLCVDDTPEVVIGSVGNQDSAYFISQSLPAQHYRVNHSWLAAET